MEKESVKKEFKHCKYCKKQAVMTDFIGQYESVKLFESECLYCGYLYIFRIDESNKDYLRTGNLQYVIT